MSIAPFDHMVLQGHVTNENHYISTTSVTIRAKLGRTKSYFDKLLPRKLHEPLI